MQPEEYLRLSDIPQYLLSFYPKLGVPRDLLPPPSTETLVAAITAAVHTAETQSAKFPWVRRRITEALHEKEHQWAIFVAARRMLAEQLRDPASLAQP